MASPLIIVSCNSIVTIGPPPGSQLLYCLEVFHFPEAVGCNSLSYLGQVPHMPSGLFCSASTADISSSEYSILSHMCHHLIIWERHHLRSQEELPASTPVHSVLLGAGSDGLAFVGSLLRPVSSLLLSFQR